MNSDNNVHSHSAPDSIGLLPFYYRGSSGGSSGGVGGSSGDEDDYGEKIIRTQPRRQRIPPPTHKTFINKEANKVYRQTHLLGEGAFGYVHVAVDEKGEKVALKTFKIFDIMDADVEQERRACQAIRDHKPHHPNVVAPLSYFKDGMDPCLTMELCSDKTLDTLLESRYTLQEHEVRYFGQQLVAGVAHLHSLGLVHNDLKPLNLLLTEDLVLKVGDFGQTQELREGKEVRDVLDSLGFQAPEVLRRERLTNAVDVFAIGAIFFKMFLGVDYKLPGEMADGKKRPAMINGSVSPSAKDLLQRTLESDPASRIKMPDLVVHPFLNDGPIPQSLAWDILRRPAPLATEDDGGCQGEGVKLQEEETGEMLAEPTGSQEDAAQIPDEAALTQEEPTLTPEPAEPDDEVDLDEIFAEIEEARQVKALVANGAKKEKGSKEVAVCGGKKVWEDDSDDDEEERAKDRKKVKVMQKGVVNEKAPESKEGGHGGDQND